jgi:hypothetical protein
MDRSNIEYDPDGAKRGKAVFTGMRPIAYLPIAPLAPPKATIKSPC